MRKFDTSVQYMKYKALKEVARYAWEGTLNENLLNIPNVVQPGAVPITACCIYKERAIFSERVRVAMGGDKTNPNIIEVINIACDQCPAAGYEVTGSCRGCLAHRCENICKRGALYFDANHTAHIDKTKCVECGSCAKACPFGAIVNHKRPCQNACKIKAISIGPDNAAAIDYEKCIQCGACVYQCPFGALADKSFIVNVIEMLKGSENGKNYPVYALLAPAVGSQFSYAKLGQIVTGLKMLGFSTVLETAIGADMVTVSETAELQEKDFMTSSCCPAFVRYIKTAFPELAPFISHNPSPMVALSKYIKEKDPSAKTVFIGPCTAKKAEFQLEDKKPFVDAVLTFEELLALLDSRDVKIENLDEEPLDNASYFGRIFGHIGGLSEAVVEQLKETGSDFKVNACICDGIEECKMALLRKSKNALDANFIEGMACIGGCVNGAGNLTHSERNRIEIDKYSNAATKKTIAESVDEWEKKE